MGLTSDEDNDNYLTEDDSQPSGNATLARKRKKVSGRSKAKVAFSFKLQKEFPFIEPADSDPKRAQCRLCPASKDGKKASFRCER